MGFIWPWVTPDNHDNNGGGDDDDDDDDDDDNDDWIFCTGTRDFAEDVMMVL